MSLSGADYQDLRASMVFWKYGHVERGSCRRKGAMVRGINCED